MSSEIPFSAVEITQADIDAVTESLRSGVLSCGERTEMLESQCAKLAGRREGVAVSSGTAALHCMLIAAGVGPGDEVITTPLAYIAATNCILYTGAKPVFVDVNPKTLNLDPQKVEAAITPTTRAIVAVETFGQPCGMEEIEQVARRHELILLEDACEGFGSKLGDRSIGSFGRASCFSFSSSQAITGGEGGVVVSDDDRLIGTISYLRNQGRDPSALLMHQRLGFSYRMTEMSAALALSQMSRLPSVLERRRSAAQEYFERLLDSKFLILPTVPDNVSAAWYAFTIRLNDLFEPHDRDSIINHLRGERIGCANLFPPIHLQPHVMQTLGIARGQFPATEYLASRTIALPLFTTITKAQIERVCEVLDQAIERVLMGRCGARFSK